MRDSCRFKKGITTIKETIDKFERTKKELLQVRSKWERLVREALEENFEDALRKDMTKAAGRSLKTGPATFLVQDSVYKSFQLKHNKRTNDLAREEMQIRKNAGWPVYHTLSTTSIAFKYYKELLAPAVRKVSHELKSEGFSIQQIYHWNEIKISYNGNKNSSRFPLREEFQETLNLNERAINRAKNKKIQEIKRAEAYLENNFNTVILQLLEHAASKLKTRKSTDINLSNFFFNVVKNSVFSPVFLSEIDKSLKEKVYNRVDKLVLQLREEGIDAKTSNGFLMISGRKG